MDVLRRFLNLEPKGTPVFKELVLLTLVLTALYYSSVQAMFDQWINSNTYSHGLFILPMAIYLLSSRFKDVIISSKPTKLPFILIGCCSLIWFLANLMHINLIEQIALVSIIPLFLWARFGVKFLTTYITPICFLYFSIPFGDFLIPHLQEVTADLSVAITQLFPIPIYRNGLYISIPNGDFLVAEACSGIRFLFTTIIIGTFYALLFIQNRKLQALYILIAIILPIFANGIRVFMIIAIAHYVDMEAATGFDHLVYGWVFFTLVFLLLLYVGEVISRKESSHPNNDCKSNTNIDKVSFIFYFLLLFSITIGPLAQKVYANAMSYKTEAANSGSSAPEKQSGSWKPRFVKFDNVEVTNLDNDATVYEIVYKSETSDKELINFQNKFYSPDNWNLLDSTLIENKGVPIRAIEVTNILGKKRYILYTYKIANQFRAATYQVKLLQLKSKLTMQDFGGTVFIYSVESDKLAYSAALDAFNNYLKNIQE